MSLKLMVNDPKIWNAFCEELDELIGFTHRQLEQAEGNDLYRYQGAVSAYKKLKMLRDKVNGQHR